MSPRKAFPRLASLIALAMIAACGSSTEHDDAMVPDSGRSDGSASSSGSDGFDGGQSDGGVPSGPGATSVFSYPDGFAGASDAIRTASSAGFKGDVIQVTAGATGEHEAGSAWYTTQQNIQAFTTDFTFQPNASGAGSTFCVQNSNSTTNPNYSPGDSASADANLLGYGAYTYAGQYPIGKSIAVKFDLTGDGWNSYPSGGHANSTGLYINGGAAAGLIPEVDLNPSGIDLHSGNIMAGHIVYDGSLLTMTLRDTVTGAQFRISWPIDIPSVTGSNSAWVGFTAGTIPAVAQNLLTWSFSEGYAKRLPPPSFDVVGGSYPTAQTVSISAYPGASIYYTTNGQQPTSSSSKYTGPISVSSSQLVQAIAIEAAYTDSLVSAANYQIAPAGTPLIDFTNGFANAKGLVTANGSAQVVGSALQLTDATLYNETGSAWYVAPVSVQKFTTSFQLQLLNAQANGMTFTLQNQPPASTDSSIRDVTGGPNAVGNGSGGDGYSGVTSSSGGELSGFLSSMAIKFDLYTDAGNTTGLYINGADTTKNSIDMTSSGVSLHSGNPLDVTLAYDGTTLAMTITDTKTQSAFSKSWPIDIPKAVGGSTAYVGFTGSTGGQYANQDVLSWTYSAK